MIRLTVMFVMLILDTNHNPLHYKQVHLFSSYEIKIQIHENRWIKLSCSIKKRHIYAYLFDHDLVGVGLVSFSLVMARSGNTFDLV